MADIFTIVKGGKKKVYNIAGGTEEEAMKYVRYLHKNALFGTHTGLPPQIKNSKMNESLVSNIGDYSVIDVYAKQLTKCMIGTVVNFILDDTVNPLGETYVYPCTDKNKPMGYMISDATPDTLGVCLVHGVLEVPLYYFGEEGEKRNYVEYDLENKCFKFSDSGYPVFNVYQDVDGDWIAIILFGDVSSDYEYDGPFAVSVAGVTGGTMFVDVADGDFIQENERNHFYDEDLMSDIALGSGETLWLNTYLSGATWEYSFEARTAPPTQSPGGSLWYRIAENTGNDLVQLQYGDIVNDIQHLEVQSVSGSTAFIRISGYSSSNRSEDNIMLRGIGCSFNTFGHNDIGIIVEGSTGGTIVQHLYSDTKVIEGTTVSSPAVCLSDSAEYINIVGGTNTSVALGVHGEIIVGSTYTLPQDVYQDLTNSVTGGTATVGITGSNSQVNFEGMGNNYITKIRAHATPEEIASWGTRADGSYKNAGWRGIIPFQIFNKDVSTDSVMTEVSISSEIGGVETEYPLIVPDTTDEELSVIASLALGEISVQDVSDYIKDKALTWAENRISQGKSPFYNGDAIDESLRNIPNADNVILYGVVPSLVTSVYGNTATVNLVGSTSYVKLIGEDSVLIEEGDSGEIIIDSKPESPGSFSVRCWDEDDGGVVHYFEIFDTDNREENAGIAGWIQIGNRKYAVANYTDSFTDGDVVYLIGTFDVNNDVYAWFTKIRTFFPTIDDHQFCVRICYAKNGKMYRTQYGDIVQPVRLVGDNTTSVIRNNVISFIGGDLTSSVTGGTATVGITGSTSDVLFTGEGEVTIKGGTNGEIVVSQEYKGPFAVKSSGVNASKTVTFNRTGGNIYIGSRKFVINNQVGYDTLESGKTYWMKFDYNLNVSGSRVSFHKTEPSLTKNQFAVRLAENVAGVLRQIQYGDIICTDDAQDLTSSVTGGTAATVGITGSTDTVKFVAGSNTTITEGQNGEIILGSTSSGGGGGSVEDIQFKWYPRYTSGSTTDRIISITGNTNQTYSISADWNDPVSNPDPPVFDYNYLENTYSSLDFPSILGGDVIVELPNASTNSLCIKIYALNTTGTTGDAPTCIPSRIVVVAPDGTPILNELGASVYSTYNAQLLEPGLRVYIFNPNCREIVIGGSTYTRCWHSI